MAPPSGDDLWNLDAFLDVGPAPRTAPCKCGKPPVGCAAAFERLPHIAPVSLTPHRPPRPPAHAAPAGRDPLLAFLDAPSQLCGCAAGCSCGCMDWAELAALPPSPRAAAPAFARPPFASSMLHVPVRVAHEKSTAAAVLTPPAPPPAPVPARPALPRHRPPGSMCRLRPSSRAGGGDGHRAVRPGWQDRREAPAGSADPHARVEQLRRPGPGGHRAAGREGHPRRHYGGGGAAEKGEREAAQV